MTNLLDLMLPYQKDFILAPQKKKLWLSGRQLGKSFTLAWIAVQKALSKQDGLTLCVSTGSRAANELVKKADKFSQAVKVLTDGAIDYTTSSDSIKFTNGSRVLSLPSGNPAALRGYTAAATIIDECAFIDRPYEVWEALAPTLTRDPDSELIVASTPAGKSGLFYDLYSAADPAWYVQTTTVEDAKRQGLQIDIEQLRTLARDPEVFNREYMCQFAQQWSSMIDLEILDFIEELPCTPSARWIGMDVGSTTDRTAMVTLAQCGDILVVEDIAMLHKASYEHQLDILKQLHQKYNYTGGYIDQNGIGSCVAEFAKKQVTSKIEGFTWTGSNKTPAYENLRAQIFDHKLKFLEKDRDLICKDFSNVHRGVSEAGKVSFQAGRNENGHADCTSAIVLALQAAKTKPASFSMPQTWSLNSIFGTHMGSRLG